MNKCPIWLVECKYHESCFRSCHSCIQEKEQYELESILLETEIKSYNQALEDALNVVEWDGYTLDIKERIKQLKK